jgi:NADP-dependent 3-hydroxy acid dehydrogenase YdfG
MFENLFRLDGKIAVVTGAGNGLGRSFALGLAAFGAIVICADKNREGADETAALAKQSRGQAEAESVDVADEASVEARGAGSRPTTAASISWSTTPVSTPRRLAPMNTRSPIGTA